MTTRKSCSLTYIALNYLAMGEYENARVAIKQTHELEAVIAELRSKETGQGRTGGAEEGRAHQLQRAERAIRSRPSTTLR